MYKDGEEGVPKWPRVAFDAAEDGEGCFICVGAVHLRWLVYVGRKGVRDYRENHCEGGEVGTRVRLTFALGAAEGSLACAGMSHQKRLVYARLKEGRGCSLT